jgi:hypothetical protein
MRNMCAQQSLMSLHCNTRNQMPTAIGAETGAARFSGGFVWALKSGVQFGACMREADAAKECSVPPGNPCMTATTVRGLTELGVFLRSFAPSW